MSGCLGGLIHHLLLRSLREVLMLLLLHCGSGRVLVDTAR